MIGRINRTINQSALKGIAVTNHDPLARIAALEHIDDREFLEERAERDGNSYVRLASTVLLVSKANKSARFFDSHEARLLKNAARMYHRLGLFELAGRMEELAGDYRGAARDYRRANIEWEGVSKKFDPALKIKSAIMDCNPPYASSEEK